jgi:hypothetical protein
MAGQMENYWVFSPFSLDNPGKQRYNPSLPLVRFKKREKELKKLCFGHEIRRFSLILPVLEQESAVLGFDKI